MKHLRTIVDTDSSLFSPIKFLPLPLHGIGIMDWLESVKKEQSENEAITNEVAAQAHLENYALKLFLYADKQDREGNFGK